MKKLLLIDGNSLLFRAYYATAYGGGKIMCTSDGVPTNAIFALANMIRRIIDMQIDYALVAFDTGKPTFRHNQYADYKAGRKPAPDELKTQFPLARELFELFGFKVFEKDGFEADDIIGTMAKLGNENDLEVVIYSGDRDLLQLINNHTTVHLTKKGVTEIAIMNEQTLYEEFEVTPSQIKDLKGLMGDSSDNIPGIKGIGEKTAVKLIKEYGTLEKILEANVEGKVGEKLKESKSDGIMSKELATIYCDLPLDFTLNDTLYNSYKYQELRNFFIRYEMRSHLTKLIPNEIVAIDKLDDLDLTYQIINNSTGIELIHFTNFFTIFSDPNPFIGEVIGFCISDGGISYFISYLDAISDGLFLDYLSNPQIKKNTINIKKVLSGLSYRKINIQGLDFDLLLALYLLDSTIKEDDFLLFKYFNIQIPLLNLKEDDNLIKYYCYLTKALAKVIQPAIDKLNEKELINLYEEVEKPLTFILSKMEVTGINIDTNILDAQAKNIGDKLMNLEKEIILLAGEEFNLNSPSQMGVILFDVLKLPVNKKRSTAVEFLEELVNEHPIIELILLHRKYSKLLSNYLVGLKNYIRSDGKLHTIFNQALTQTGRLSSSEPNLQNISIRDIETKEVRKAFVPENKKNFFLSLDYSQIELRVLASFAKEDTLIEAFNNGEDIHARTASEIFKCSLKEVTKEMRRQAKVVNFGILYGMSDWGLASEIGVPVKEAKQFIATYFESFPKIKNYLEETIKLCKEQGYVKTILNRIRYVPEINDNNHNVREFGKRVAMNSPIQGSAADIIKLAMIEIDNSLRKGNYQTKMLIQIHDELVFEVPNDELMLVIPLISAKMENAIEMVVKMKVEYEYGVNWYEC